MPSTTAKGVPYSLGTDTADTIDSTMQSLAEWVDAAPGVSVLTTAQRDALPAAGKWNGRIIQNVTTGRLERYSTGAAMWISASEARPELETLVLRPPAASIGVQVVLAAGATGDVLDVRNSALAQLAKVGPSGHATVSGFLSNGDAKVVGGLTVNGPPTAGHTAEISAFSNAHRALTLWLATGQTASALEVRNNLGAVIAGVGSSGFVYAGTPQTTFMSAVNGRIQAQSLDPGVTALTAKGAVGQTNDLIRGERSDGLAGFRVTPNVELVLDRRYSENTAAIGGALFQIIRKDGDTGDFFVGATATAGIRVRINSEGRALFAPDGGGFVTNAGLEVHPPNGSNPGLEVRQASIGQQGQELFAAYGNPSSPRLIAYGHATSATLVGSEAKADGLNQLSLAIGTGTSGDNASATAVLRMVGQGIAHGDIAYHSGHAETFRFSTTGSAFSGGAAGNVSLGTLYYNGLSQKSESRLKDTIDTLDVRRAPASEAQRGQAGERSGEATLARLRRARPVSYRLKENGGDTRLRHGFIAEEIADILPEVAVRDLGGPDHGAEASPGAPVTPRFAPSGKVIGYDLGALVTLTVGAVQDLLDRVEVLETRLPSVRP